MEPTDAPDQRAQFAEWLRQQLTKRGYDLTRRGGGQSAFIRDSGIGAGTVSRLLAGTATPDIRVLRQLATALDLPLGTVLLRAGIATPEDLAIGHRAPDTPPLTPDEAADNLGIYEPAARAVFIATVTALQSGPPTSSEEVGH